MSQDLMSEFAGSQAEISSCGTYRYRLTRIWGDGPRLCFVMLNPSTADAVQNDPTIRRCIGFAMREGCGSLDVVNLYAFRATKPALLLPATDPVGPENAAHLAAAGAKADRVVAAWGAHKAATTVRMLEAVRDVGRQMLALGVTARGMPRHPLYVRADAPLTAWAVP